MAMPLSSFATQDVGKLFEPDAILPAQFYAMFKCSQHKEPERRLMVAVLEDAVHACRCILANAICGNVDNMKKQSSGVAAEEESEWSFSFRNIVRFWNGPELPPPRINSLETQQSAWLTATSWRRSAAVRGR